jgi:hypothetical protein
MRSERLAALLAGAGALCVLGALYVVGVRRRAARGDTEADLTSPLEDALREATGAKVLNRERAAGVDGRLQWLLDEWERLGTHVVRVAGGTFGGHRYAGGVRDLAQQLDDFNAGLSKANGPDTAPHMHGGAIDVWPKDFVPNRSFADQPVPGDYIAQFRTFAAFARERDFEVGFDWPNPDMPHVQVRDWRSLPLPLSTQAAKGVET